jgi:branched-chain amino acid transport system substrate-binding protein
VLAGFVYSPDAFSTGATVTAGKKLAILMNAGTAHITLTSPYWLRTSFSMWHSGYPLGTAAVKELKAKTAVIGFSDFPPGKDERDAFKKSFEEAGGKVLDEIPMGGPVRFRTSRRSSSAPRTSSPTSSSSSFRPVIMRLPWSRPTERSA